MANLVEDVYIKEKMKDLRKFIKTTIREYLNENQDIDININNNFWKWFGNSMTIKNGKPIIFHHFTDNNFNVFVKKTGVNTHLFSSVKVNREAFFFTTDSSFGSIHGNKKYDVYLKIDKIFNFDEHYFYKDISPQTSDFFNEIVEYIEERGVDLTMEYQSYRGELKIKPEHNWMFLDNEIGKYFVDFLKKNGYDGCFFIEEGSPVYAVFESNQIKSVENDGTWDNGDDNIFS